MHTTKIWQKIEDFKLTKMYPVNDNCRRSLEEALFHSRRSVGSHT